MRLAQREARPDTPWYMQAQPAAGGIRYRTVYSLGEAAGDHALHHVLKGTQGRLDSPRRALPAQLAFSIPQSLC